MSKSQRSPIPGIGLFLLIVAGALLALVLLANFHMARSETQSSVTTASSRWPQGASVPPQTIYYRVEGDGPLVEALADALAQGLPDAAPVGETAVPALIVRVDQAQIRWSPVVGRAEVAVTTAFSSNGDFAFREERPFFFQWEVGDEAGADHIVQAASEITVTDQSAGLLSRPGYVDMLADALTAEIDTVLQTHVFAAP